MVIGQKTPQKRQIVLTPFDDLVKLVSGPDRTANHKKQNFRQRMGNPPALPVVLQQCKMVQKNPKPRPIPKVHGCLPMHPILESDSQPKRYNKR